MKRYWDENKLVKLAPKGANDTRYKPPKITPQEQAEIDFCLACKKKNCVGGCRALKEFKRGGRKNAMRKV